MLMQKKDFFNKDDYSLLRIIQECFSKGQENGEFKSDLDPEFMTQTISNLICMVTADWCYFGGNMDLHEEFRKQYVVLMELFRK
jgi:hypothetical protein